jgi:hypothetical protein
LSLFRAVLDTLRYEATTGFGRTNIILMVIAGFVILALTDDVPALIYNGVVTLAGHEHSTEHLSRPPFWQAAVVFLGGLVLCMGGTGLEYARFKAKEEEANAPLVRERRTGKLKPRK